MSRQIFAEDAQIVSLEKKVIASSCVRVSVCVEQETHPDEDRQ